MKCNDTYGTGQHWSDILLEVDLVQKGHVGNPLLSPASYVSSADLRASDTSLTLLLPHHFQAGF